MTTSPPPPPPPPAPNLQPLIEDNILSEQLFGARMKAHDFVQEHLKQIITIASEVLAVTITFLKDLVGTRGDQLEATWLLSACWVLLGLSILFSVYTIAVHVNNLDWPDKDKHNASFAAGYKHGPRILVLISVLLFAGGMLSLGVFAAFNYDLLVRRGASEHKLSSAYLAVAEAEKQLTETLRKRGIRAQNVGLSKVELIKGVDDSLFGLPVWSVQYQIKPESQVMNASENTPSGKRQKKVQNGLAKPQAGEKLKEDEDLTITYLLDAKSGALITVPKTEPN